MWGSIPAPWEHDLSRRQMLNRLSHPGSPMIFFFKDFIYLRAREQGEREHELGEGQADSPLSREPNTGLDPRTLRS